MSKMHEGSYNESSTYLTHKCKSCGESTGRGLHIDLEPHLCKSCQVIEKRDTKLNSLLANKNWWEIWK